MLIPRRIQLAVLASTLVGGVLFLYILYSIKGEFSITLAEIKYLFSSLLISNLVGIGMFYLSYFLNQKAPWHIATAIRFLMELVVLGLYMGLIGFVLLQICLAIFGVNATDFYNDYHDPLIKILILSIVVILIYTILDFTLYSYNQYAAIQIEHIKINSTQLALQLEVLKTQLSPHYLFNSLNTISSLMYQNPDQAEQFIRKLAHTYQYILATQDRKLVPLSEEVNFLKAYFYLLKARFEDAVHLNLELPRRALNSKIPPLTLQLLLENAVKHNAPTDDSPLHIRIFVSEHNRLVVSNNILTNESRAKSFKIGLDNIRQRYQYYAEAAISVIKSEEFVVELPLLYPAATFV